jgi:hypothetical protein
MSGHPDQVLLLWQHNAPNTFDKKAIKATECVGNNPYFSKQVFTIFYKL